MGGNVGGCVGGTVGSSVGVDEGGSVGGDAGCWVVADVGLVGGWISDGTVLIDGAVTPDVQPAKKIIVRRRQIHLFMILTSPLFYHKVPKKKTPACTQAGESEILQEFANHIPKHQKHDQKRQVCHQRRCTDENYGKANGIQKINKSADQ